MNKTKCWIAVIGLMMAACDTNDDQFPVMTPNKANMGNCPVGANDISTRSIALLGSSSPWSSACILDTTFADKPFKVVRSNIEVIASKPVVYTYETTDANGNKVTQTKTTDAPITIGSTANYTSDTVFYDTQDCSGNELGRLSRTVNVKVDGLSSMPSPDPNYAANVSALKVTMTYSPTNTAVAGVQLLQPPTGTYTTKDIIYSSCTSFYNADTKSSGVNVYSRLWWQGDLTASKDNQGYPKSFNPKNLVQIIAP